MNFPASDRKIADAATELIADFGANACFEAAERAYKSRDRGNTIKFCHWRQVERLIQALESGSGDLTIH